MKLNKNLKNYAGKCVKNVTPGFNKTAVLSSLVVGKWSDAIDSKRQRVSTTFEQISHSSMAKTLTQSIDDIWMPP